MKRYFHGPTDTISRFAHITDSNKSSFTRDQTRPTFSENQVVPILHLSLPSSQATNSKEGFHLRQISQHLKNGVNHGNGQWIFHLSKPYQAYSVENESVLELASTFEMIWQYLNIQEISVEHLFFSLGHRELGCCHDTVLLWLYNWESDQNNLPVPTLTPQTTEWSVFMLSERIDETCTAVFGKTFADLYPPLDKTLPKIFQEYFNLLSNAPQEVNLVDLVWMIKGDIDLIDGKI
ncbi:hypothetical protein ACQ4M3_20800 [Leptolyngbya sp. AN03gr2]|uniref:hypothetical protein n=1 Tax=unclassified Leptolyngbya TaxID=2650499 RepID=UPI003D31298F